MELRKQKKRNSISKEEREKERRELFWEFLPPKKKLDTVVNHQNKHTIEDQGCSWLPPRKIVLSAVFYLGFK